MKLYIDDQFNPVGSYLLIAPRMGNLREIYLTDWHVVRSFGAMQLSIQANYHRITHISFDFDLDQYENYKPLCKNGLDCAIWVKEFYETNRLPLPLIYIHSRNFYGIQDIAKIFPGAIAT